MGKTENREKQQIIWKKKKDYSILNYAQSHKTLIRADSLAAGNSLWVLFLQTAQEWDFKVCSKC